jgi:hypothetical protein
MREGRTAKRFPIRPLAIANARGAALALALLVLVHLDTRAVMAGAAALPLCISGEW